MADEKTGQEPSMEEILASIRQIISEDEAPAGEGAGDGGAPNGDSEDILELTQMVVDDGSTVDLTDQAGDPAPPPADDSTDEPVAAPEPVIAATPAASDPLISDAAATASVAALSRLAKTVDVEPAAPTSGGRSVEELAVELLRPMLRQWIDENLPPLVERVVQREIRRLVRRAEPE